MAVQTGQMRDRITITTASNTLDAVGGDVPTPSTLATVWALVEPMSAAERVASTSAVTSAVQYRVTIRYRSDVTAKMRITHGARSYEINGVLQSNRQDFTVLECAEVPR